MNDTIEISEPLLSDILQHCWDATSKLESQIYRNESLPVSYKDIVTNSFKALKELEQIVIDS